MISKNDITKIAKKILRRQRGLRDHQIIHPQRDWFIGLFFSLVVLIGVGAWSCITYFEITNRAIEVSAEEMAGQTIYRSEIVEAALSQFRERAENYQQLLENRVATPVITETLEPVELEEESTIVADEENIEPATEAEVEEEPEVESSLDTSITPELSF